jgi:hypothetical protein
VKYTDYAIGKFLSEARDKPWFKDTIFVFLADHTAGSAGHEDLPVANYHIPLFIYAPGFITPREVSALTSQIDLAPTLLGLLHMDYVSTFYGRDVLRDETRPGRALIGNYQHLGLFDGKGLAILSPRKKIRLRENATERAEHECAASPEDPLMRHAIAYYEGASHAFRNGLLAWRTQEHALAETPSGQPMPAAGVSANRHQRVQRQASGARETRPLEWMGKPPDTGERPHAAAR